VASPASDEEQHSARLLVTAELYERRPHRSKGQPMYVSVGAAVVILLIIIVAILLFRR
jgi:hypothetical protein